MKKGWKKDNTKRKNFDNDPPSPRFEKQKDEVELDYWKKMSFVSSGLSASADLKKEESHYRLTRAEMYDNFYPTQIDKNTFGLGSAHFSKEQRVLAFTDKDSLLHNLDEKLTQAHLDKLISVSLIVDMHDGAEPKEKMLIL